jgi:hypothetical protein
MVRIMPLISNWGFGTAPFDRRRVTWKLQRQVFALMGTDHAIGWKAN